MVEIKNILLTGATGYLGSHLAKKLVNEGYSLYILKRLKSSLSRIEVLLPKVQLLNIEEINYNDFFRKENIHAIVHTAALYGRNNEGISELYNSNLFFPLQLLESALKYKVKYFFNSNTTLPADLNLYALSKAQFAQVLNFHSININVIDVQLQYFYGPKDDVSKFVTFIMSKLNLGASYIDLTPGTQIRDFIYIDDVIDAFVILLKNAGNFSNYQPIPVGTGIGLSLKNLAEKIKSKLNNQSTILNFGAVPFRTEEIMYAVADITILKNLGWKTNFTIDKGLEQTIKIERSLK